VSKFVSKSFAANTLALAVCVASMSTVVVAAEDSTLGLEEVVVTAQKREQSFQDLAISAAVLSAEALEQKGISQVQDALRSVPGVKIQNVAGTGSGRVFIRGIGTTSGDEFDGIKANGVSLNLDGVQSQNASNTLGSMFDVERVEVLKGPQGTLYGSGALGGVVNVITAKPKHEFEGRLKVQKGNYGQQTVQAMLNLPISDTFAVRVTGTTDERDGFVDKPDWLTEDGEAGWRQVADNAGMSYDPIITPDGTMVFPGFGLLLGPIVGGVDAASSVFGNYGAQDNEGYRIKALWTPSDDLSLLLTYDSQEQRGTSPTWINSDNVRKGDLVSFGLVQETEGTPPAPPAFATASWYETRYFSRDAETITAELGYHIDGFADLTATVSHNEIEDLGQELTLSMLQNNIPSLQEQDVYELRLNSLADSDVVWVAGIYMQKTDRDYVVNPDQFAPSPADGSYVYQNYAKPFDNANVYGQMTMPLSEDLRLTLGGRYSTTSDDVTYSLYKTANPCTTTFPGSCPTYDTVAEENFFTTGGDNDGMFTWKVGLEYDLAEDRMMYAQVATGAKAGGLQFANTSVPITVSAALDLDSYDAEESISLEIGSKNRLLDNTLQINGALFYTEWDNMQINTLVCAVANCDFTGSLSSNTTYVAWYNATKSTQYGLELDVTWLATENGRVAFSSSFMKGEYGATDYIWQAPGFEGAVNLDGMEMANTPAYSGNLSYTHTFPMGDDAFVEATIEEEFSDSYQVTHEWWWLGATQDSYMRTNVSVAFHSGPIDINVFARNLENETTIQSVFPFGVQGGEPRIYGASLSYNF